MSGTYKDLTNKTFGKLTVLKITRMDNKLAWECVCECGKKKIVKSSLLLSGRTKSCGCIIVGGYRKNNKILKDKKCKNCSKIFTPDRTSDKFCSSICGDEYWQLISSNRGYPSQDKSKSKNAMAKWRKENPAKRILSNIKSRGNIDLDLEWVQERLDVGRCEVTNIKFETINYGEGKRGYNHTPWTPSIDKIDPIKGYTKENCQMVVWAYNRAKGLWGEDIMAKLAKGMYDGLVK